MLNHNENKINKLIFIVLAHLLINFRVKNNKTKPSLWAIDGINQQNIHWASAKVHIDTTK